MNSKCSLILKNLHCRRQFVCNFSSTGIVNASRKKKYPLGRNFQEYTDFSLWRNSRGFDSNPNKFGPLTNLPDYSYVDGRVVPLGSNITKRLIQQKTYAEKIVKLSGEIDFAMERYNTMNEESKIHRKKRIEEKLKTFDQKTNTKK